MITRSAIFRGKVKQGCENAFYAAVRDRLVPAWAQMLHATAVRVYRPIRSERYGDDIFLVQEIDYPSQEHLEAALASVQRMYDGAHDHIIYERLTD